MDNRWGHFVTQESIEAPVVTETEIRDAVEVLRGVAGPQQGILGLAAGEGMARFITDNPEVFWLGVHGGAGDASGTRLDGQIAGCQDAAEAARQLLEAGASALDAVQRAVSILEDDPRFNAATGGALTCDGTLELETLT